MKKLLLSTAMIISLSSLAHAADVGKSYFSLRAEANFGSSSDYKATQNSTGTATSGDFDSGFGGGIAIGHYPTSYIRTELALDYRHHESEDLIISGTAIRNNFANNIMDAMVNIYFDMFDNDQFSPYLGGGVGMVHEFDQGDNAFAYQLMAGMSFKTNYDGAFFAGYKYFGSADLDSSYNDATLGRVRQEVQLAEHIVEVGYRYNF